MQYNAERNSVQYSTVHRHHKLTVKDHIGTLYIHISYILLFRLLCIIIAQSHFTFSGVCCVVTSPKREGDSDIDVTLLPDVSRCSTPITVTIGGIRVLPELDNDRKITGTPGALFAAHTVLAVL
jgi:hypothetical protein